VENHLDVLLLVAVEFGSTQHGVDTRDDVVAALDSFTQAEALHAQYGLQDLVAGGASHLLVVVHIVAQLGHHPEVADGRDALQQLLQAAACCV